MSRGERYAGEQMKQIWLDRPVTEKKPSGQKVVTFEPAYDDPNPWAHVRDQRGDEGFDADKKTATMRRTFQVRMRSDVDVTWTVREDGKRWDIKAIHPIGRRKLDIVAEWTQGQYND